MVFVYSRKDKAKIITYQKKAAIYFAAKKVEFFLKIFSAI